MYVLVKLEIIRKLIEAGSTPEVKMAALETELKPHCFGVGQKEKVKILLDEGHVPLAPCTPGERGYCLEDLFFAFGGDPEMIAYTIEKGANVNYKLPGGGTPYMFALYNTYSEAMDLLVKHGAKIEGVREVELLKAVERGDYQKTTELVKKVSDLNLGSLFEKEKSTLFDLAFQGAPKSPKNGQKDYGIVRLLINSGASVNDVRILNTYGYNDRRSQGVWYQSPPLVLAIESGQLDLVKRFVKAGANLNFIFGVENPEAITPVFTKFTPLDFAIPGSDIEVYLIKEGAKRRKDLP
jgi:hypothetical protein